MRRFEESERNDFERYLKLGEDNAKCIDQMRQWCKHVEIQQVSAGLYARMTGLPIGSHSVGCPHVAGGMESMNLRWIFSDFLVEHCADCAHHAPNGDSSWGQEIIRNHQEEEQRSKKGAKEEADRISRLRSDLRLRSKGISAGAEPEAHRILEFLEALFSEGEPEREKASERLRQSARLGADLFPDGAIDLVLALAGSGEFSSLVLPVCAELAGRRPDLATRLTQRALENIAKGLHPELSAWVLDALGDAVTYPLGEECIGRLLLSQQHHRPIGGWRGAEPDYSHSTAIIVRSFDADPESVQNVIRRELRNENDYLRVEIGGAILLVQKARPQIAVNLLYDLVRSLELHEDERLSVETPSGQIIRILQLAFRYSSQCVDEFLSESMSHVRPAVQEDIIRVYREQCLGPSISWKDRCDRRNRADVSEHEKVAIQRFLTWAKDDHLEIDIRVDALEALEVACDDATAGVLSQFDSLLGYFAIVSTEERPPAPPPKILLPDQPPDPQIERLNEFNRTQQWHIFKERLRKCLKVLCEARPSDVFASVSDCLNQPLEHLEEGFKACCVSLLGKLGKNYLLRPDVLRLVWRGLMDYGSAWVRAEAIDAVVEMFPYSSTSPPANLVDVLIVHLQDPKVVVHQAALRAVSRRPYWFSAGQSVEVLKCLGSHLRAYRDDKYQLDDICDGILAISWRDEHLMLPALRMVESCFPTGEATVDSHISEELIGFCEPSERLAELVAKDIGTYLGQHKSDRINGYERERQRMFEWLHALPEATFQRVAEDLLASARRVAKRDAWESCQFASVFAHFRAFAQERSILEATAEALPDEPRYESFRRSLRQLATIAGGNALLQVGDRDAAEACFAGGRGQA